MMWDGKHKAELCNEIWVIRHKLTGEIVFEYQTYQGNKKKCFFKQFRYAEEALRKYIKDPEMYFIMSVKGSVE